MLTVKNISKSSNENMILKEISFEINKGEFIAVMGPSGSGKSTLLYSISGMDRVSSGDVWLDGSNLVKMKEEELARIRLTKMGFVFQNAQMLKNLSLFDNIILPGLVAKQETAETIRERATKLMQQMGIVDLKERDIRDVSGGQLQRACICRAMINQPNILFLDEPTGALNSEATSQVLDILHELNQEGMTIVIVTHDPKVAAKAKKVFYLSDGQVVFSRQFTRLKDTNQELEKWLNEVQ